MRSSSLAINSVFQRSRKTCHVPRANAVKGMRARRISIRGNQGWEMRLPNTMRPGPCRFPLFTRLGGLSTIEKKFGSSAGVCANRR